MRGDPEVCFVIEHKSKQFGPVVGSYHLLKGYRCNETFQFICEFETKRKLQGKHFECYKIFIIKSQVS